MKLLLSSAIAQTQGEINEEYPCGATIFTVLRVVYDWLFVISETIKGVFFTRQQANKGCWRYLFTFLFLDGNFVRLSIENFKVFR